MTVTRTWALTRLHLRVHTVTGSKRGRSGGPKRASLAFWRDWIMARKYLSSDPASPVSRPGTPGGQTTKRLRGGDGVVSLHPSISLVDFTVREPGKKPKTNKLHALCVAPSESLHGRAAHCCDGLVAAAGEASTTIRFFEVVAAVDGVAREKIRPKFELPNPFSMKKRAIYAMAFSADGVHIAVCGNEGKLAVFARDNGGGSGAPSTAASAASEEDGGDTRAAAATAPMRLKFMSEARAKKLTCVTFTPDADESRTLVAAGGEDGRVQLFDVGDETATVVWEIERLAVRPSPHNATLRLDHVVGDRAVGDAPWCVSWCSWSNGDREQSPVCRRPSSLPRAPRSRNPLPIAPAAHVLPRYTRCL